MTSGQNMTRQCPQCGAPVSAGALEGLCPACLLRQGVGGDTGGGAPFEPPNIAEIGRLFPQLEILGFIGKGGMGAVYKARQPTLDRIVALKILPPQAAGGKQFAERFAREARALARLNHPNIVAVHDFGQVNGMPFFVMEFVDGLNLREMERANRLSPREALQIVPQICEALQFAHDEGVVHRDIKPENILLDKRGRVKIADFGIAKIMGAAGVEAEAAGGAGTGGAAAHAGLTEQGKIVGTPNYMAPEQVETPQNVDHRADIFSLGVVFYEMLTGELPLGKYAPPSSRLRGVAVDVRLDEVVLRALEREPERRYQQASQVKTAVQTIADQPSAQGAQQKRGINYRSRTTLFGLPLVHVATDMDPATGRPRVARGIIAIGGIAQGVFAFGGVAMGGLAVGGVAVGGLAFGGCAVGLASFGGLALAVMMAMGGLAVAPVAIGGGAIGYFAYGGGALAVHPLGANASDEAARHFFMPWAKELIAAMNLIFPALLLAGLAVTVGVPFWLQRKMDKNFSNSPAQPGPAGIQGANQNAVAPASLGAAAVFFAGLAGVLGAIALCLLPTPPQVLVWGILASALAGIVLGIVSRKTAFGKQAVAIGIINVAIWLGVATVCWLRVESLDLPPPGSLVGCWQAEGNTIDSSFYSNDGTFHGGATYAGGKVGSAFAFNNDNTYVKVPNGPTLNPREAITLTAWIYPIQLPENLGAPIIKKAGNDRYMEYGYTMEYDTAGNDSVRFGVCTDAGWMISPHTPPTPTNTWSFVAGTYDGTKLTMYFDGQPVGSVPARGAIIPSPLDLEIGHDPTQVDGPPTGPPRFFSGLVDEASVYDAALSAAQIRTLYKLGMAGQRPAPDGNPPATRTPVLPGLVSCWAAENNADDLFGTNNGILGGGAGFAPGKVGRAFSFDGINGTVVVPDSPDLRLTGKFTLVAWVNTLTTNGDQAIISKVSIQTGNHGYQLDLHGNRLTGAFNSPDDSFWPAYYVQTAVPIIPGTWHHAAWTYDQSAMVLYFDGEPVATNIIGPQRISVTDTDLRISGADDHVYFYGLIDEAGIYRTALSAAQIQTLYKLGVAGRRPAPGPKASPPRGSGESVNPTAGSASAETWSPTLAPGEKPDFSKIMGDAKELMNEGHYEEALQREIWYFNHSRSEPGQGALRLSFALADWIELGRRYPKAKQALMEIRDRETHEIQAGRGYSELVQDVQAINHELQDDDATYALFLTMRTNDPQLAGQCYFYLENQLVAKGEYQWCYDHMGDPQARFDLIHRGMEMQLENQKRFAEMQQKTAEWNRQRGITNMRTYSPPDNSVMLGKAATNGFVGGTRQLIEILVATGHEDVAKNIRDQAVQVMDDPRLQSAVTDAEKTIHAAARR